MPLVDLAEFKTVLGVGDLYPDTQLEQVMDAASDVILDQLQRYKALIDQVSVTVSVTPPGTGTTIDIRTTTDHLFQVGQQVILRGVGIPGFDERTFTITVLNGRLGIVATAATAFNPGTFEPRPLVPLATVYLAQADDYYAAIPEVREAALAVAVDMWQSRVAPGGQIEAVDFTPGPYRLGRSLLSRVSGLLARWVDTRNLVG
jgi:hypothetical protein